MQFPVCPRHLEPSSISSSPLPSLLQGQAVTPTLLFPANPASSAACFSRRRFCLASRFLRVMGDPEGAGCVERGWDLGRPREGLSPHCRKDARGK